MIQYLKEGNALVVMGRWPHRLGWALRLGGITLHSSAGNNWEADKANLLNLSDAGEFVFTHDPILSFVTARDRCYRELGWVVGNPRRVRYGNERHTTDMAALASEKPPPAEESAKGAFQNTAVKAVEDVLGSSGFVTRPGLVPQIMYAQSGTLQIEMCLTDNCVTTAVRLLSEANEATLEHICTQPMTTQSIAQPCGSGKQPVDLFRVLDVLAPDLADAEKYPTEFGFRPVMKRDLERQLRLITEKCRPLLHGNLELWSKVRGAERLGFGRKQQDMESREAYLLRLKTTAESALRKREYWTASGFYATYYRVGGKMSLGDWYNRCMSDRHTFRIF